MKNLNKHKSVDASNFKANKMKNQKPRLELIRNGKVTIAEYRNGYWFDLLNQEIINDFKNI